MTTSETGTGTRAGVGNPNILVEDDRTGMHPVVLRRAFTDHVEFSRSRDLQSSTAYDRYIALSLSVRDRLVQRWVKTQETYREKDAMDRNYLAELIRKQGKPSR